MSLSRVRKTRAKCLFVVRESNEYDESLMDAMRDATYQPMRHVPEVEAIRKVGLLPLRANSFVVEEPDGRGGFRQVEVIVETLRRGRTSAVLFSYGGYWHLWSMSSAYKTDSANVNDWTEILLEVVKRLQPEVVRVHTFSRLVRNLAQAGLLMHAMVDRVDRLVAAGLEFPMSGPMRDLGSTMFMQFAQMSAWERHMIVQRLTMGKIAKWRRGEWTLGKGTVPFGYRFDAKSKRLVPRPELRDHVRQMLIVLTSDATPEVKLEALDRLGVTLMRKHRRLGEFMPLRTSLNKAGVVRSLYAWAPIWLTGEHLMRYPNPFDGLDEVGGVTVSRCDPDDREGELQMLHRVPLPDGGWAEQEVLDAFRDKALQEMRAYRARKDLSMLAPLTGQVLEASKDAALFTQAAPAVVRGVDAERAQRRGGAAKKEVSPFAGRSWVVDGFYYELQASKVGEYQLWRWPVEALDPAGTVMSGSASGTVGVDEPVDAGAVGRFSAGNSVDDDFGDNFDEDADDVLHDAFDGGVATDGDLVERAG